MLVLIACNARTPTTSGRDQDSTSTPLAARSSAAAPTGSLAPVVGFDPSSSSRTDGESFRPVTAAEVRALQHEVLPGHPVKVSLEPYCAPAEQDPGSTRPVADMLWLGSGTSDFAALYELLSATPSFIGLHAESRRKTFVASYEPSFTDWAAIQVKSPKLGRFGLELRPGCHTLQQRQRAEQLLKDFAKDPTVGLALHAWRPDPSNAGYYVQLLPGSHEAEKLVRAKLGSIANIWFTRPAGEHATDKAPLPSPKTGIREDGGRAPPPAPRSAP